MDIKTTAFRDVLKKVCSRTDFKNNTQNIHTPFDLCFEIIEKFDGYAGVFNKTYLVMNIEFIEVLVQDFGISKENITFITDCPEKAAIMKHERYKGVHVVVGNFLEWEPNMKFDVIVGNPPYQAPSKNGKGDRGNGPRDLWDKFVKLSFDIVKDNGFVCLVHPSKWRKPGHYLWKFLKKKLHFLYIGSKKEGYKVFGATTRFDWYVASAKDQKITCKISDENHQSHNLDLSELDFMPNYDFDEFLSIVAKKDEETCEIFYDASSYHNQKEWMSDKEDSSHKYPCVYGMYQDGSIKCLYSSEDRGHFGVSKVIISCGEHPYPLVDMDGKYGTTNNTFFIVVSSKEEAEGIKKALESEKFAKILESTKWGNFQIEYKMFKYFKKDFWKEFV